MEVTQNEAETGNHGNVFVEFRRNADRSIISFEIILISISSRSPWIFAVPTTTALRGMILSATAIPQPQERPDTSETP